MRRTCLRPVAPDHDEIKGRVRSVTRSPWPVVARLSTSPFPLNIAASKPPRGSRRGIDAQTRLERIMSDS
jgi:hypothetical protein